MNVSGAAQDNLSICRTSGGKPYFASRDLFFSISHAKDTVAVALSNTSVGIDIEFIDERRDILSLSRRFFAPDEHKAISESNSPAEDFFSLWTKKEALAKITGEGLSAICRAEGLDESYSFSLFSLSVSGNRAYISVCRKKGDLMPTVSEDFLIKYPYAMLLL
ncbi:MAG: 4'-phosphopantetheinyl transferase superfamily protein, partial [Clostridia bacterium]|nr:4'-phosphopantetheinyl transferase superfamily protein [Clostridia bacterium]